MSNPADTIALHVKTELQYDIDSQQGSFPSGSISQLSVTVSDSGDHLLNVYYINNGKVFNARENPNVVTAGSTNWSILDTRFRKSAYYITLETCSPSLQQQAVARPP
jgi:hypothetical protein